MWQPLVTAGLAQWPAAMASVLAAFWAQTSKAGNTVVSLPFSFLSSAATLITRTKAKGKTSVFSSNKHKPCVLLLTQSVTKNSSELKKNLHESCIDSSRKMKSIFHLACIQLLQEHNTTLMCCQERGSFSAEILQ